MSLDTKFRPLNYSDVLGQENSIKIMRRYVATGAGLRQSYLLAGPYGGGKTTLGRILARALLCPSPTPEGDPCDACESCLSMLATGSSVDFMEVDAATNSGKADVQQITEDIEYSTFSGRRRIYLFDEAHQLSRDALDAMLKPLEEDVAGTQDKKLVCIFCTTEPERMRVTVISRCAPVFIIRPVAPEDIAKRLEYVCQQEGFQYEPEMLKMIAEMTECHVRDALKAIEGVSMLGSINKENVTSYLHLDLNTAYLEVLENIGTNIGAALDSLKKVMERTSPVTCYEKLAEVSMLAYQTTLGAARISVFWDAERLKALGQKHGPSLLGFAAKFATRPGRPSAAMLFCDIGSLHYGGGKVLGDQMVIVASRAAPPPAPAVAPPAAPDDIENDPKFKEIMAVSPPMAATKKPDPPPEAPAVKVAPNSGTMRSAVPRPKEGEVLFGHRAVGRREDPGQAKPEKTPKSASLELSPSDFCKLLALRVGEMDGETGGQAGRPYLDSH